MVLRIFVHLKCGTDFPIGTPILNKRCTVCFPIAIVIRTISARTAAARPAMRSVGDSLCETGTNLHAVRRVLTRSSRTDRTALVPSVRRPRIGSPQTRRLGPRHKIDTMSRHRVRVRVKPVGRRVHDALLCKLLSGPLPTQQLDIV